jgi:hypothetical protein
MKISRIASGCEKRTNVGRRAWTGLPGTLGNERVKQSPLPGALFHERQRAADPVQ